VARGASVVKATNREIRPTRKPSGFFVLGVGKLEIQSGAEGERDDLQSRVNKLPDEFQGFASGQAGAQQCCAPTSGDGFVGGRCQRQGFER